MAKEALTILHFLKHRFSKSHVLQLVRERAGGIIKNVLASRNDVLYIMHSDKKLIIDIHRISQFYHHTALVKKRPNIIYVSCSGFFVLPFAFLFSVSIVNRSLFGIRAISTLILLPVASSYYNSRRRKYKI